MEHLLERIRKIEALISGASSKGEKSAAMSAKARILEKYPELGIHAHPKEFSLYTRDYWQKKLLLALCRRYGVQPYRYHRQKHTTVMVYANTDFVDKVLWKDFLEYSEQLETLIQELTDNLINQISKPEEEKIIRGKLEGR